MVSRRAVLAGGGIGIGGALLGSVAGRAFGPGLDAPEGVPLISGAPEPGTLNDASQLSRTPVHRHITLSHAPGEAELQHLRAELAEARAGGRALNIGAARHSMGGQAIPRDGHAITFDNGTLELDSAAGVMRCRAGLRWNEAIQHLDRLGHSPKVMQSNNEFGVAATFSVNAHGWPAPFGPMGSTVRSLRLMLADGEVITASRTENAEIFRAAMGGYGLIGLILDLEVEVVPNMLLAPRFDLIPAEEIATAFPALAAEGVPMAYGRLNVDRAGFFREGMLVSYRPATGEMPALSGSGFLSRAARPIFRAQYQSEWVKRRRWSIETGIGATLAGNNSRNNLLNEPVITLDDRNPNLTDILHEYFVAPEAFPAFLEAARATIAPSYQELLNVTLRWVEPDRESLLSFAPSGPRIASVLLFSQEMSARAEADMARVTRELIDAVHAIGGSYYLPYRPHATLEQFTTGYPRAGEFAALKRQLDPAGVLGNGLWDRYLSRI